MKRIDFLKICATFRGWANAWREFRTPVVPVGVYMKLGEALRGIIQNNDVICGCRMQVMHGNASYILRLSARIEWYIDEESAPAKRYVIDIEPMEWCLTKWDGETKTLMTEYADFDKITQYAID